jgi:hypothetical protein
MVKLDRFTQELPANSGNMWLVKLKSTVEKQMNDYCNIMGW